MTVRGIHLLGSPVLREQSSAIRTVDAEVRRLVADLYETMYAAKGVGLAANQVGVARRVAVIDTEEHKFAMINPVIVEAQGRETAEEGCLSIPKIFADVTRPDRVVLEALNEDGEPFRLEASGLTARAIQHELDHLDGILFVDHLGLLKRKRILTRWKKDHEGDTNYVLEVKPESAGST